MYKLLAFGDSNTYGYVPSLLNKNYGLRYRNEFRFAKVIEEKLAGKIQVVENGMPGRSIGSFDHSNHSNQTLYDLIDNFNDNAPIDLIMINLGTNDLINTNIAGETISAEDCGKRLIGLINGIDTKIKFSHNRIMIVVPVPMTIPKEYTFISPGDKCIDESKKLGDIFFNIAKQEKLQFFDTGKIVKETDPSDGVHLNPRMHILIGKELSVKINNLISSDFKVNYSD